MCLREIGIQFISCLYCYISFIAFWNKRVCPVVGVSKPHSGLHEPFLLNMLPVNLTYSFATGRVI